MRRMQEQQNSVKQLVSHVALTCIDAIKENDTHTQQTHRGDVAEFFADS